MKMVHDPSFEGLTCPAGLDEESFARAREKYLNLPKSIEIREPVAWLRTVAARERSRELQRDARYSTLDGIPEPEMSGDFAEAIETRDLLTYLIAKLPFMQRVVVRMKLATGYTFEELAERSRVNASAAALQRNYSKAMANMKKAYEKEIAPARREKKEQSNEKLRSDSLV